MYTGNPSCNKIDAVRLIVGDVYEDMEVLDDDTYQYFLDKNSSSVNRAAVDAAWAITFKLSRWTRERTGDIEVYGSEWARGYRQTLMEFLRNPNTSIMSPLPFGGGTSKSDMLERKQNTDNNMSPFYLGMADADEDCVPPVNDF